MDHEINPLVLWSEGEKIVQDVVSLVTIILDSTGKKKDTLHVRTIAHGFVRVCNIRLMISSFPQEK